MIYAVDLLFAFAFLILSSHLWLLFCCVQMLRSRFKHLHPRQLHLAFNPHCSQHLVLFDYYIKKGNKLEGKYTAEITDGCRWNRWIIFKFSFPLNLFGDVRGVKRVYDLVYLDTHGFVYESAKSCNLSSSRFMFILETLAFHHYHHHHHLPPSLQCD